MRSDTDRAKPGFTIIELLVVITIIAVIGGIGLAVASRVTNGNKARASENLLRVMDQVLEAYVAKTGANPPAFVKVSAQDAFKYPGPSIPNTATIYFPVIDGRAQSRQLPFTSTIGSNNDRFDRDRDPPQPTVSLFLLEATRVLGDDTLLKGIDSRFVTKGAVSAWGWRDADPTLVQFDANPSNEGSQPALQAFSVLDAWGRPIRMVHPQFAGGAGDYFDRAGSSWTSKSRPFIDFSVAGDYASAAAAGTGAARNGIFSRSCSPFNPGTASATKPVGDADEGVPSGNRPYFYTTGADGQPGDRADNLYTTKPSLPPETARIPID
jgi:prepilin-type N-terminal cleavage/methylation domain-containing protein